jgi:murein DD-endopeptidase MepM/ murein hydrolase activator NlpD
MKKSIFTTVLMLVFVTSFTATAQKKESKRHKVVEAVINNYKSDNNSAIYKLFDTEMQKAMPENKTAEFFNNLRKNAGAIKNYSYLKKVSTFDLYKIEFEKATLQLNISINKNSKIDGFAFRPYVENKKIANVKTDLTLPFDDEWYVVWGGDTEDVNYHVILESQKGAFDCVIHDSEDKSFKNDRSVNENFYCFGKKLYAPCKAEVIMAVDGIKDNIPGVMNNTFPTGNTVVLKTENNEYIYICHFKQFSVKVKQGDIVNRGDLLGLCGNSGRSSEAHLHFHIQNNEYQEHSNGLKAYFSNIVVNKNQELKYSPLRGDRIENNIVKK